MHYLLYDIISVDVQWSSTLLNHMNVLNTASAADHQRCWETTISHTAVINGHFYQNVDNRIFIILTQHHNAIILRSDCSPNHRSSKEIGLSWQIAATIYCCHHGTAPNPIPNTTLNPTYRNPNFHHFSTKSVPFATRNKHIANGVSRHANIFSSLLTRTKNFRK